MVDGQHTRQSSLYQIACNQIDSEILGSTPDTDNSDGLLFTKYFIFLDEALWSGFIELNLHGGLFRNN